MKQGVTIDSNRVDLGALMTRVRGALVVLLVVSGPAAAQEPGELRLNTATNRNSYEVVVPTKLEELRGLATRVFNPNQGLRTKATTIVQRFPLDPTLLGLSPATGQTRIEVFCQGRGTSRLKNRLVATDAYGNSFEVVKVPARRNCSFVTSVASFVGNQLHPAKMPVTMKTTVQRMAPAAKGPCFNPFNVCLGEENRFKVNLRWQDFEDNGRAVPVASSTNTGNLYFFDAANTQMTVNVFDGCGDNGFVSVHAAAATDLQYTFNVTDTQTGQVRTWSNPLGTAALSVTDTQAFPCS